MTYRDYRWFLVGGTGQQVFAAISEHSLSGVIAAGLVCVTGLGVVALIHRYTVRVERRAERESVR